MARDASADVQGSLTTAPDGSATASGKLSVESSLGIKSVQDSFNQMTGDSVSGALAARRARATGSR